MRRYFALAAILFIITAPPAFADGKTMPASVAAGRLPVPTFRQLHNAYTRLTLNESGFKSRSDQEGIFRAILHGGGGRNHGRRARRGTGYGLDYTKLMARMARHSSRTFPRDSKFLVVLTPEKRARKNRLRTYQNDWTSTFKLDCSRPAGWKESVSKSWHGYEKRCALLVESTREVLQGKNVAHCDGPITTWGSKDDRHRQGGALDSDWHETQCDRPPQVEGDPPMEECAELRAKRWTDEEANRRLLNSTNCARNYFFSWLTIDEPEKTAMVIE